MDSFVQFNVVKFCAQQQQQAVGGLAASNGDVHEVEVTIAPDGRVEGLPAQADEAVLREAILARRQHATPLDIVDAMHSQLLLMVEWCKQLPCFVAELSIDDQIALLRSHAAELLIFGAPRPPPPRDSLLYEYLLPLLPFLLAPFRVRLRSVTSPSLSLHRRSDSSVLFSSSPVLVCPLHCGAHECHLLPLGLSLVYTCKTCVLYLCCEQLLIKYAY